MASDQGQHSHNNGIKQNIDQAADKAHEKVDQARDQAKEVVHNTVSQVEQQLQEIQAQVQQASTQFAEQADHATTVAGERMVNISHSLRGSGPATGLRADVAERAANTLEQTGAYLQHHDVSGMRSDLEKLIRKFPLESVLIGVGTGFWLARVLRNK